MYDFAPMYRRHTGETFVSPQYCWRGEGKRWYQCSQAYQDKWIHPVKTTTSDWIIERCARIQDGTMEGGDTGDGHP